jgi:hypothetical protein
MYNISYMPLKKVNDVFFLIKTLQILENRGGEKHYWARQPNNKPQNVLILENLVLFFFFLVLH